MSTLSLRLRRAALGALLMLAGCAFSPGELEPVQLIAPPTLQPSPTPPPLELSTAALVRQRAQVIVGIRYDAPPLARVNAEGELEGFEVDLARALARRWLGSERNVRFVPVTSRSALQKLQRREIDLAMGGMVHTREGELSADYSLPLTLDGEALLIRAGTFADFAGLARRTVDYIDVASTFALRDAQIANGITVTLRRQNSYRAAVNELLAGNTDGVAGRWRRLRATAAGDPALQVLTVFTQEPIAIALPPNDSAWANLVNITLSALMEDGTFAQLYTRWFGEPPLGNVALPRLTPLQLVDLPERRTLRDPLRTVRARGSIVVAFAPNAAPFAAANAQGAPEGFEVDVVRELARRWFNNPFAVQFIAREPAQLSAVLANGEAEIALGGLARDGYNELVMDFSMPLYQSGQDLIALGLPENASTWRDVVNLTLQEMLDDGTLLRLLRRWFPAAPPTWFERLPGQVEESRLLFNTLAP